eukprot:COSAG01_NODE_80324_length_121_cov_39.000000_1_plen_20_part_01
MQQARTHSHVTAWQQAQGRC